MPTDITDLQDQFIDMLYVMGGLKTKPVEAAFRNVPRHFFIDRYYNIPNYNTPNVKKYRLVNIDPKKPTRTQLQKVYSDWALVSHQNPPSSSSQPSLVAHMLETLNLKSGMNVLEIGAGTGWNAALMGNIVGPRGQVHTIDIQADVARRARRHIRRAKSNNVTVLTRDGFKGHPDEAPYDRFITTVSVPDIMPAWIDQLKDGGQMVLTLNEIPGEGLCFVARLKKQKNHLAGDIISLAGFMTFTGKHSAPIARNQKAEQRLAELRSEHRIKKMPAPWTTWMPADRQYHHDLIFFTYLEGLEVEPLGKHYALRAPNCKGLCITGPDHFEICGKSDSYDHFLSIFRKWIGLKAPRRHNYRITVWPIATKTPPQKKWLARKTTTYKNDLPSQNPSNIQSGILNV